jgi:long-chain fatty acid transport protein
MHNKHWQTTCAGLALLLLTSTGSAFGSGFGIFTQGATELGQANASVAHTNGPSAVYFNPALMSRLQGTQVEIGTTLVAPDRDFTSAATGLGAEVDNTVYFPSSLYLTRTVNDQLSLGLAVYNPFGLGTEWPEDWEGRYLATKSTITTFNINPALAYKLTPKLTLAAGLDLLLLDAELERKIPLALLGSAGDANQKFSGDGDGLGYNLGLLIDITPELTFGSAYRSEIEVDIDANVRFDPAIPGVLPNTSAKTTINLPQQLTAGLAYQASSQLTVEAGVRWEDWTSYQDLTITTQEPILGSTTLVEPKDWRATWAANLGARYQLNPTVALLGGYLWAQDAVPAATFEPGVPDATSHLFCLGTDLKFDRVKLAASYAFQQLEKRDKNNDVGAIFEAVQTGASANGSYESSIHLLGVSLGYQF